VQINKKLIKYNFTADANKPEYIVIHDTGNYSNGANAEMHYQYFNGGDRQASAHFFIDSTQILQVVEIKDKSWHCGDGANKYGINNTNSIGVEICINSDGDYNKSIQNAVELTLYLMKTYNISIDKVVRHYDASRKNCPQTMNNNGDWSKWNEFKSKLTEPKIQINAINETRKISTDSLNVRELPSINSNILGQLKSNDTVTAIGISSDNQWYKIFYNRVEAYISAKYTIAYDSREDDIKKLVSAGVISSPDYWVSNAKKDGVCNGEYVSILIKNMAKKL